MLPPFDQNPSQQFFATFLGRILLPPLFSQLSLDPCLEDGRAVSLQLLLYPLEGSDADIQLAKQVFDLSDDAVLL